MAMDKKLLKLIDEVVNCLDWSIIVETYREYDGDVKRPKGINAIKRDLKNLCKYIISNNIKYFDQEQFIVKWEFVNDKLGSKLEIIYVPTKSCAYTQEPDMELTNEPVMSVEEEIDALKRIINEAVLEENYELAAIIRDRIKIVQSLAI